MLLLSLLTLLTLLTLQVFSQTSIEELQVDLRLYFVSLPVTVTIVTYSPFLP